MAIEWDRLILPDGNADEAISVLEHAEIDCEYLYDERILVDAMKNYEVVLDAVGIDYDLV